MTTMNPATRRLIKVMPEDVERDGSRCSICFSATISADGRTISPRTAYKYLDQLQMYRKVMKG